MALKRLMPPSVRYSYTTAAPCSPDCGRASGRFSTWTITGADDVLAPGAAGTTSQPPSRPVAKAIATIAPPGGIFTLLERLASAGGRCTALRFTSHELECPSGLRPIKR